MAGETGKEKDTIQNKEDGLPPEASAFNILEEKALEWINLLEVLEAMDPDCQY